VNFADTNWLASTYIAPQANDLEAVRRSGIVERFLRQHGGQLVISHIVLLEARNVFSRITGEQEPPEWQRLTADFGGRVYVDPMNWDLLRRECHLLFSKYAWQAVVGTFDTAIIASMKLAGGRRFLSFDSAARALAAAERIDVYPPLETAEKRIVSRLKHKSWRQPAGSKTRS
jgi:predicted nucleic acid-binding protein